MIKILIQNYGILYECNETTHLVYIKHLKTSSCRDNKCMMIVSKYSPSVLTLSVRNELSADHMIVLLSLPDAMHTVYK